MLEILNSAVVRQYLVVITVNFSVLSTGMSIMWSSPMLVKLSNENQTVLERPVTTEEGSWIVSIGSLSSLLVNFFTPFLLNNVGRRGGLMVMVIPKLAAGIIFIFATKAWMLYLARALGGAADTGVMTMTPIYVAEVSTAQTRGSLGTVFQIMCSCGVVLMLSIGPFLDYLPVNIIFTCIIAASAVPLLILPESPYYLYTKGKTAESSKVLTFLRNSEISANEEIQNYAIAEEKHPKANKRDILKNKTFWKSLILTQVLSFGLQLVGFNAVSFYLQTILESTETSVSTEIASVVIGCIQLLASICTATISDKFGRKTILIVTGIGMSIGMGGLGLFFKLKDSNPVEGALNYVPLVSLILVVFCYSAGLGSLFWVVAAELFDDHTRAIGMSLNLMSTTICLFLTTKYFAQVTMTIGATVTYWIFSINGILLLIFIGICIPETKGKTYAEIQEILRVGRRGDNTKC